MKDRIQISSVCLSVCTLLYAAIAWQLHDRGGEARSIGIVVGAYSLGLYASMGVLAIDLKRWAWRVANVAFIIHLVSSLALVLPALQRGWSGFVYLGFWFALGAIGLWANLQPASRAALAPQGAS